MKTRILTYLLLVTALTLTSCNLKAATPIPSPSPIEAEQGQPVGVTPSLANTLAVQPGNTPAVPTNPLPTDTPTLTLTLTPSTAMVSPKSESVNCRFGPGTSYLPVGGLKAGASVPVLAQNGDGTWWEIQNPNDIFHNCWVSAVATNVSGNVASIPLGPAPQPSVTLVTVNPPDAISMPGCVGSIPPLGLSGTIDVNGPVTVTYHFETEQGGALPAKTLAFTKFGPLNVTDSSYTPPLVAGTYWVKLFVTAPNSVTAQASYTIACP